MTIETVNYCLPAYWAGALINGDYSGLTDYEESEVNTFMGMHPELGGALTCSDYPEFQHGNDWLHNQGGDVLTFTFPIIGTAIA